MEALRKLQMLANTNTDVQGTPQVNGFTEAVLYGPWFAWHKLPFVPKDARRKIRARAARARSTIERILAEAARDGTERSTPVGDQLNAELMGFMRYVYDDCGLGRGLRGYMQGMAIAARAAACAAEATPDGSACATAR